MGRGPKISFADTHRDRRWESRAHIRRQKRRRATVWDAVAGRVGKNGWLSNEPVYSKNRDTLSSSTRPISAAELLYRRKGARVRAADEIRPETGVELPPSELSSALHRYVSRFFSAPNVQRKRLQFKSMDFSALIAMTFLLEELVQHSLGETGHLAFLEGEPEDGAAGPPLFWNGKKWAQSVVDLPQKKRKRRVLESEEDVKHFAEKREDLRGFEDRFYTSDEDATTESEADSTERAQSFSSEDEPIQFVSSRLLAKLKNTGQLDLVGAFPNRHATKIVASKDCSPETRGSPPTKRLRSHMLHKEPVEARRSAPLKRASNEFSTVDVDSDVDMDREEESNMIQPRKRIARARSLPSRKKEPYERVATRALDPDEDRESSEAEETHREESYLSIPRHPSTKPSMAETYPSVVSPDETDSSSSSDAEIMENSQAEERSEDSSDSDEEDSSEDSKDSEEGEDVNAETRLFQSKGKAAQRKINNVSIAEEELEGSNASEDSDSSEESSSEQGLEGEKVVKKVSTGGHHIEEEDSSSSEESSSDDSESD